MNITIALWQWFPSFLTKKNSGSWEDWLTQDGAENVEDEKKRVIVPESKQAFKEEQGCIERIKVYILTKGFSLDKTEKISAPKNNNYYNRFKHIEYMKSIYYPL